MGHTGVHKMHAAKSERNKYELLFVNDFFLI
jgi:hypothetical protein